MNADQILWHYRCDFVSHEGLYEQYEKSYFIPGYCDRIPGYWNTNVYWRLTSKGHDYLNSTYYTITQVQGVDIDKQSYREYLERPVVRNPWRKGRTYRWSWYRNRHNKGQKYVRRPHHQKKELTEHEAAKREWRSKKKDRDFKGGKPYWKQVSPYFKVVNKKKHRAYEREMIAHERYDDLHAKSWKREDIWGWD